MLYVQQSLGPNEEILMGARFHWMYTVNAVFWILMGLGAGIALAYGAIWWEISQIIRAEYPGLPDSEYQNAQKYLIEREGGYMTILWGMHPALRFTIMGFFILGLFIFASMMIVKATTEIAITTDRLIYKRGLIARHVGELSVDRVEGVTVAQGILGRMLGYGRVNIRGMGIGEVVLPPIDQPIEFRRAVQEAQNVQGMGSVPSKPDEF
ncbi:MAG: PH domain-containing protein [Micavibrio sp.]|nr:MAG: PH domain-containing protein [Micavibrio sp.]